MLRIGNWRRVPASASVATYEGCVNGVSAVLAVSGIGRAGAEATVREVLEVFRPSSILSLGFAGGLTPGQRAGDIVVALRLIPMRTLPNGDHESCDTGQVASHPALSEIARRVLAGLGLRHETGTCVTASHMVSRPEEKRRIGMTADALAVEMESFWIGKVCREFSVPFLAVRSIVDEVDRPIPGCLARLAMNSGREGAWRRVLPTLLRPWRIPDLVRLATAASAARESLTAFMIGYVDALERAEKLDRNVLESHK